MSKQNTRAIIDANIKQNGQQLITGQILNSVLNTMVTDYAEQAETTGKFSELEGDIKEQMSMQIPRSAGYAISNAGYPGYFGLPWNATDFLLIKAIDVEDLHMVNQPGFGPAVFYDKNKEFLSSPTKDSGDYTLDDYVVPDGAVYVRFNQNMERDTLRIHVKTSMIDYVATVDETQKIAEGGLRDSIFYINGFYNNSGVLTKLNADPWRASLFLSVDKLKIRKLHVKGYYGSIILNVFSFYDADRNYISGIAPTFDGQIITEDDYIVPEGAVYVAMTWNVDEDHKDNFLVEYEDSVIPYTETWNYVDIAWRTMRDGGNGWKLSSLIYLPLIKINNLYLEGLLAGGSEPYLFNVLYYNKYREFIGGQYGTTDPIFREDQLAIPEDAVYVRFSWRVSDSKHSIDISYSDDYAEQISELDVIASSKPRYNLVRRPLNLNGKNIVCFGDSIMKGYVSSSTIVDWSSSLATKLGATIQNNAVPGAYLTPATGRSTILSQMQSVQNLNQYDVMIIGIGTNDFSGIDNYGQIWQALSDTITYINQNFNGEVIWITPIQRGDLVYVGASDYGYVGIRHIEQFVDTMTEHIQQYDSLHKISIVHGLQAGFPDSNAPSEDRSIWYADNLHPTELGYMNRLLPCVLNAIG